MAVNIKTRKIPEAPFFRSMENGKSLYKKARVVQAVNIDETEEQYVLSMVFPGFRREDFKIEINKKVITICAVKNVTPFEGVSDGCDYDYTNWNRSFTLPNDAEVIFARAKYWEGELTIRIPKGTNIQTKEPIIVYIY